MPILSHPEPAEHVKPEKHQKRGSQAKADPKPPHAYREAPDFRYVLRLKSPKSQTRAIVRVFEVQGTHSDRTYYSPQVLLGNYEMFPKGLLIVESPKGGWRSDDDSKRAIRDLLSTHPGDKNIPKEFFAELNEMQIGFMCDMNQEARFQARRMES